MKKKNDNIIKRWHKLTQPHKGYWAGQIITYVIYAVMLYLITIFAAKTINSIYNQDWTSAYIFLGLEILTIVFRNVSLHVEYLFYGKQHIHIRNVVAKKIYNKVLSVDDKKAKEVSKEKIQNIALNNMSNLAEFPDSIASFLAYSIQVVITLITVFVANWIAGILITVIGVINFFAYYTFNKKLGLSLLKRHEQKDVMFKSYSKIMDGKSVINEYNTKEKYQEELIKDVDYYGKEYARYYNIHSGKANLWYATWNVLVYAVTALMLFFVSKGTLDVAIYLIIVPYLTTCTDKLNSLFDKTSALENMRVDVDRVNLILNLDDKQLIKYGNINIDNDGYNLGLIDVSCDPKDDGGVLKHADISFKMHDINIIKGERGSGKRVVFNLLRRYVRPDKGKVLLDNLDLYDYNEKTFKNHIDFCASQPVFIKGSIKENLLLANNNFEEVQNICKKLDIHKTIEKYTNGYDTQIDEIKSKGTLFLIGLSRALLSYSHILMIYELPINTPESFNKKVLNFLKNNNFVYALRRI